MIDYLTLIFQNEFIIVEIFIKWHGFGEGFRRLYLECFKQKGYFREASSYQSDGANCHVPLR